MYRNPESGSIFLSPDSDSQFVPKGIAGDIKALAAASGIESPEEQQELCKLYEGLSKKVFDRGELPSSPVDAAEKIRNLLHDPHCGNIRYDQDSYTFSAVLREGKGNCVSIPLLVSALLTEKGIPHTIRVITNLKDELYHAGRREAENAVEDPLLEFPQKREGASLRAMPYDHLVISAEENGVENLLETTPAFSPSDGGGSHETQIEPAPLATFLHPKYGLAEAIAAARLSLAEASAFVLYSRAVDKKQAPTIADEQRLLDAAAQLYPAYPRTYYALCGVAEQTFDDSLFDRASNTYLRLAKVRTKDESSSLLYYQDAMLAEDLHKKKNLLDKAISHYVAFADAYLARAFIQLQWHNEKESPASPHRQGAKLDYTVAAYLYAHTKAGSYETFLSQTAPLYNEFFGTEATVEMLRRIPSKKRTFFTHLYIARLTSDARALDRAWNTVESPRQKAFWYFVAQGLDKQLGRTYAQDRGFAAFDAQYANSQLYLKLKEEMGAP